VVFFAAITVVAVAGLLFAQYRDARLGVWIAKPLASTGFIGAALAAGALGSTYGQAVLVALALCWLGDVLLIPRGASPVFRAGLVSFLLGHIAYGAAFILRGVDTGACVATAVILLFLAISVLRWLLPHVSGSMRVPVYAYVVVISAMVALAAGTVSAHGDARIFVGALGFFVSDLAVARERFVISTFWNGAWGRPLYYAAQLILAATVAGT
jgi:uncharacterized membrane protein YhhN